MQGISESLAETETELLLGISVSREQTLTHDPTIENMTSSLNGICSELIKQENTYQIADGIAVYAAWEASEQDWMVWEEYFGVSNKPN